MKPNQSSMGARDAAFPLTRLSLLMRMHGADAGARSEAEDVFWRAYQGPLYAYARCGRKSEAAKDLVQGYCAWVIETDLLGRFDPARGRLRSWLLMWFQGYIRDEAKRARAAKRGGRVATEGMDRVEVVDPSPSAAAAYDQAWAKALLKRAFARWKAELAADRKNPWKLSLAQLIEVDGYGRLPSIETTARMDGVSEARVRHFIERESKLRLREEITREVRESCASDADARAERDYLLGCLASR